MVAIKHCGIVNSKTYFTMHIRAILQHHCKKGSSHVIDQLDEQTLQ